LCPFGGHGERCNGDVATPLLEEGDELVEVRLTDGDKDIMMATRQGRAIRFPEGDVRSMGRVTRGVIGMRLKAGDEVVDMLVVSPEVVEEDVGAVPEGGTDAEIGDDGSGDEPDDDMEDEGEDDTDEEELESSIPGDIPILTLTEYGFGKRTFLSHYRKQGRGGKGIYTHKITNKNGPLRCFKVGHDDHALMVTTVGGMVIRTSTTDIRKMGRHCQGVKVIRLKEDDAVAGVTLFSSELDDSGSDEDEDSIDTQVEVAGNANESGSETGTADSAEDEGENGTGDEAESSDNDVPGDEAGNRTEDGTENVSVSRTESGPDEAPIIDVDPREASGDREVQ